MENKEPLEFNFIKEIGLIQNLFEFPIFIEIQLYSNSFDKNDAANPYKFNSCCIYLDLESTQVITEFQIDEIKLIIKPIADIFNVKDKDLYIYSKYQLFYPEKDQKPESPATKVMLYDGVNQSENMLGMLDDFNQNDYGSTQDLTGYENYLLETNEFDY